MSEKLAFKSPAIFGRATLTIVMSSNNMNVATQTTISVHHFRSISGSYWPASQLSTQRARRPRRGRVKLGRKPAPPRR